MTVPHWLDYNAGVGLDGSFHHVPASYEWSGGMDNHAPPRHLASIVHQFLVLVLSGDSSVLDTSRPMMNWSLPLDGTSQ